MRTSYRLSAFNYRPAWLMARGSTSQGKTQKQPSWKITKTMLSQCRLARLSRVALAVLVAQAAVAYAAVECSIARTNDECTLTIDRTTLLVPPTIQMSPGKTLTVVVTNPHYFERYYLDSQGGPVNPAPDVTSAIVNGLLTPIQKFWATVSSTPIGVFTNQPEAAKPAGKCDATELQKAYPASSPKVEDKDKGKDREPAAKEPADREKAAKEAADKERADKERADKVAKISATGYCFDEFAERARSVYLVLSAATAPDSRSEEAAGGFVKAMKGKQGKQCPEPTDFPSKDTEFKCALDAMVPEIGPLVAMEYQLSANITAATKLENLSPTDQGLIQPLVALRDVADVIAKDLLGYGQRIKELPCLNRTQQPCGANNGPASPRVKVYEYRDPQKAYLTHAVRSPTYVLNVLNLVQNSQEAADPTKKKVLATIPVVFGDVRWEASAGVMFSSLANRSFAAASVFTSGQVTDQQVQQRVLRPTVVPFAAVNYRLNKKELGWSRWRMAIYWTGAVGVNPNTVSADFATGPSLSWRGLMFSALFHYGHDVRLNGVYVGESLGTTFKGTLPTQTYWRPAVAFGVSVRVPSLAGR